MAFLEVAKTIWFTSDWNERYPNSITWRIVVTHTKELLLFVRDQCSWIPIKGCPYPWIDIKISVIFKHLNISSNRYVHPIEIKKIEVLNKCLKIMSVNIFFKNSWLSSGYCPDWALWRRCRVSNECILFKFVWYHFKNNNISGRKTLILFCLKSVSRCGNVNALKLNLTIRYRTKRRWWPFHSFHLVLFILNAFSSYRFCILNIKAKLIIRACFL